eukprot:482299_1
MNMDFCAALRLCPLYHYLFEHELCSLLRISQEVRDILSNYISILLLLERKKWRTIQQQYKLKRYKFEEIRSKLHENKKLCFDNQLISQYWGYDFIIRNDLSHTSGRCQFISIESARKLCQEINVLVTQGASIGIVGSVLNQSYRYDSDENHSFVIIWSLLNWFADKTFHYWQNKVHGKQIFNHTNIHNIEEQCTVFLQAYIAAIDSCLMGSDEQKGLKYSEFCLSYSIASMEVIVDIDSNNYTGDHTDLWIADNLYIDLGPSSAFFNLMYDLCEHLSLCYGSKWRVWNCIQFLKHICDFENNLLRKPKRFASFVIRDRNVWNTIAKKEFIKSFVKNIQRKTLRLFLYGWDKYQFRYTDDEKEFEVGVLNCLKQQRYEIVCLILQHFKDFRFQYHNIASEILNKVCTNKQTRRLFMDGLRCKLIRTLFVEDSSFFFVLLKRRETKFIKLLWKREKKTLVNMRDCDGNDALLYLCGMRGKVSRIAEFLIINGASMNRINKNGYNVIERALQIGNQELADRLQQFNDVLLLSPQNE